MRIANATRCLATLLAISALALASAACGDQSASPTATPPPDLLSPPPVGTVVATPISPPRIGAAPLVEVTGLFSDPRPTHVDEQRSLGPKPANFAPWDGKSTMLYDVQTGTETNLGPGTLGRFSLDGSKMVWIANAQPSSDDGEAWLLEIATGVKRDLGPGRAANLPDNDHVVIAYPSSNDSYIIDLQTGARRDQPGLIGAFPQFDERTPDGYVIRLNGQDPAGGFFSLIDPATERVLLRFNAQATTRAGRGELLVITSKVDPSHDANGRPRGTANIFLVNITSGRATFVATTTLDAAYAANNSYVAWTDDFCSAQGGTTKLLDRATGLIGELGVGLWPSFTEGGLLLDGAFGGSALIDPATRRYVAAIPARGDSSWSRDYRYASLGQFGGHDGPCL